MNSCPTGRLLSAQRDYREPTMKKSAPPRSADLEVIKCFFDAATCRWRRQACEFTVHQQIPDQLSTPRDPLSFGKNLQRSLAIQQLGKALHLARVQSRWLSCTVGVVGIISVSMLSRSFFRLSGSGS